MKRGRKNGVSVFLRQRDKLISFVPLPAPKDLLRRSDYPEGRPLQIKSLETQEHKTTMSFSSDKDACYADGLKAIYVKILRTVKLGLHKLETVEDLKSALTDVVGISGHHQELLFAGNHLKTHNELAYYNIRNGSTLYMVPHSDQILIYITLPWIKDAIPIYVNESDTIDDVKTQIQEEGYPIDGLSLIYEEEHLEDYKRPLAAYNIHSHSVLNAVDDSLELEKIFVSVPGTKDLELEIKGWYTLEDVKTRIENILGTRIGRQRLSFGTKQLEDVQMLADYNIRNMSKLNLVNVNLPDSIVMHVRVWNGKTFMLEVEDDDTVKDVKMKIQDTKDISISKMSILFAGQKLEDECYLTDYNVKNESILVLVCRKSDG